MELTKAEELQLRLSNHPPPQTDNPRQVSSLKDATHMALFLPLALSVHQPQREEVLGKGCRRLPFVSYPTPLTGATWTINQEH
jgi:hypothetical protein